MLHFLLHLASVIGFGLLLVGLVVFITKMFTSEENRPYILRALGISPALPPWAPSDQIEKRIDDAVSKLEKTKTAAS